MFASEKTPLIFVCETSAMNVIKSARILIPVFEKGSNIFYVVFYWLFL